MKIRKRIITLLCSFLIALYVQACSFTNNAQPFVRTLVFEEDDKYVNVQRSEPSIDFIKVENNVFIDFLNYTELFDSYINKYIIDNKSFITTQLYSKEVIFSDVSYLKNCKKILAGYSFETSIGYNYMILCLDLSGKVIWEMPVDDLLLGFYEYEDNICAIIQAHDKNGNFTNSLQYYSTSGVFRGSKGFSEFRIENVSVYDNVVVTGCNDYSSADNYKGYLMILNHNGESESKVIELDAGYVTDSNSVYFTKDYIICVPMNISNHLSKLVFIGKDSLMIEYEFIISSFGGEKATRYCGFAGLSVDSNDNIYIFGMKDIAESGERRFLIDKLRIDGKLLDSWCAPIDENIYILSISLANGKCELLTRSGDDEVLRLIGRSTIVDKG